MPLAHQDKEGHHYQEGGGDTDNGKRPQQKDQYKAEEGPPGYVSHAVQDIESPAVNGTLSLSKDLLGVGQNESCQETVRGNG